MLSQPYAEGAYREPKPLRYTLVPTPWESVKYENAPSIGQVACAAGAVSTAVAMCAVIEDSAWYRCELVCNTLTRRLTLTPSPFSCNFQL